MAKMPEKKKKGCVRLMKVEGCVCSSLTVDGQEEIDMTDDERRQALKTIFDNLKPEYLNYVLQALIPMFGEYGSLERVCECCGDIVSWNVWDLKPSEETTDK